MSRPQKTGLEYFSFDVDFFQDRKIKILNSRYGADGIIVFIYLLSEIYKDKGYYLQIDADFEYIVANDLNMSYDKIGQIMNFLLERSLFNDKLFKSDKVLTSQGIQERFQLAIKNRGNKKTVEVDERFWVLNENKTEGYIKVTNFYSLSEKNPSYSDINPSKSEIYATKESKVKESKEKESKEKESKEKESTVEERKVVRTYGYYCQKINPAAPATIFESLNSYEEDGMSSEVVIAIIDYCIAENKTAWSYVKSVINNNFNDGVRTIDDYKRVRAEFQNSRQNINSRDNPPKRTMEEIYESCKKYDDLF